MEGVHLLGRGGVNVGEVGFDLSEANRRRLLIGSEGANNAGLCVVRALVDVLAQASFALINVLAQASFTLINVLAQASFALINVLAQASFEPIDVLAQAALNLVQPLTQSSFDSLQDFAKFVGFHVSGCSLQRRCTFQGSKRQDNGDFKPIWKNLTVLPA